MKKRNLNIVEQIFSMRGSKNNSLMVKILYSLGFKKNFKIINIVGTNGKGSTAKYINDHLINCGYKVGAFTSPHISKYNERITLDGKNISDKEFKKIANSIFLKYPIKKLMFFQIIFIVAMIYFQNNNIDYAIIEAGIGARKDATNSINGDYGVVTSIGEDHLELFGNMKKLAKDKSKIINKNMKFFLPSEIDNQSRKYFLREAKKKKIMIVNVNNDGKNYKIRNQKLASAICKDITNKKPANFSDPDGRTQIIDKKGIKVILDVAHNYDSMCESLEYLKQKGVNFDNVVISLSKKKDDTKMSSLFKNKKMFLYKNKGFNPKEIKDYNIKGKKIKKITDLKLDKNTLFIGSFYLISEVFHEKIA